ncbi:MAG: efflux RND transporter periplasmic adaptor subunit [Cyclobacteriaceae bacterium]|nr:efflux RND transporter periplasmic adaptor subunit [Cyclobacteriaceae bacterium]
MKYSYLLFLVASVLFSSCNKEKKKQQQKPQQIQVVEVIQKDVPIYSEFVGQAYGLYDIPIRARVEGFLEGIHFSEGQGVKKGQLLYVIDAQPFIAEVASQQSKVAEAKTILVNASAELNRYKPLAERNAVSQSDLDAAQATYDAAQASVEAAKANMRMSQINLSYTRMKSPIKGVIGKTEAKIGEFVGREPNPVILNTVSRIDTIRVQFFLTEGQYLQLAKEYGKELKKPENSNPEEKVIVNLILADGENYAYSGVIDFIDRSVDSSTGSLLVQASFPNPKRLLRPGMYTKVKVAIELVKNALLVPQRCVQELQGQYSVYIVNANNIIEAKQLKIKAKIGDYYIIDEGIKAGEKIVLEGLQKVGSGMEVSPKVIEFQSQSSELK